MKNVSMVFFALILALTFTASDVVVEKGNKPDEAKKCPYLENLQENQSRIQCPYLSESWEDNSSCPYLKGNNDSQTGCPYLDSGTEGECPYPKQKGKETKGEVKYLPLPEGKST